MVYFVSLLCKAHKVPDLAPATNLVTEEMLSNLLNLFPPGAADDSSSLLFPSGSAIPGVIYTHRYH